jgi:hypothetical protein
LKFGLADMTATTDSGLTTGDNLDMKTDEFMAVENMIKANSTISNRWNLGSSVNSLAMGLYNNSYIDSPVFSIHNTTVCIGAACWNGAPLAKARQLHPN